MSFILSAPSARSTTTDTAPAPAAAPVAPSTRRRRYRFGRAPNAYPARSDGYYAMYCATSPSLVQHLSR
ncbi:hypothetical protein M6D93_06590 [Jatrophihabitans telluris]|uniref:RES domain-containing protein n=1 Tax=Jatrophihabitans telluris TaxID=2038343 RepID=A0ABY4R3V7_9ACTN|nr:hypothetical protein [Jatrophihabitans telluris]UQX89664.1 hypothetical protein M6D93_06590 [Jatrophihabitans telluris]